MAIKNLKESLSKEYDMKNLKELKTIIRWKVTRNLSIKKLKICQLAYI